MKILLAKTAGFCFGVNRAVNMVYDLLDNNKKVATLGPIIHNKEMVSELENRGVKTLSDVLQADQDSVVVIRSHGVAKSVTEILDLNKIDYVDATCPFVSKIHNLVAKADVPVLIAGDKNHPEVCGIIGHCNTQCFAFMNVDELNKILQENDNFATNSLILVAQTTFNQKEWKKISEVVKKVCTNAEIFDTICNATVKRQEEADYIADMSDVVIVIGDRHSSNTGKLFLICKSKCDRTYLIETADELADINFDNAATVGVTAGASTPNRIIKEVLDVMNEKLNKSSEIEVEENFAEMLEESLKNLNTNERVIGTVVRIAPNEVQVDVGRKQAGYIPADELTNNPNLKPEDVVKVGDQIELLIMKTNDQEGTIMLSKRRVDAQRGWDKLEQYLADNTVLTGIVTEVVRGGVIVVSDNVRVFIPASQATMNRGDKLEDLLKTEVSFRLLEVDAKGRRKRAVGSIRSVLKDIRAEQRQEFWNNIEVGKTYTGTVKSLTNYGAFVDLGGVYGMIHISELSWAKIKHPSEVVNVGDTVEVYIKEIKEDTKKISLGFKKADENPWEILKNNYQEGDIVEAKIVGMTTFGAFANIITGIDGLIHISQISDKRIEKPQDALKVGETVTAKITGIDFENKRVSLSIKALNEEPAEEPAVEEAPSVEAE